MKITTISFLKSGDSVYLSDKKRGFGTGYLNGYGGKMMEGESVDGAAIRELREEAGLIASSENLQKVAVIDFFDGDEHIFECHVFFVSKWEGELKESEEMAYPQLYMCANLPYEKMW
ncbi:MAG: NUDIX domain-containing protein, partial [Patescibacteria group bacterium]